MPNCFPEFLFQFTLPSSVLKNSCWSVSLATLDIDSYPWQHLILSVSNFSHLVGVWWDGASLWHSLMSNNVEYLYLCTVTFWISSVKNLPAFLQILKSVLLAFFFLIFTSYTFWIQVFHQIYLMWVYSWSLWLACSL